jgi:uncharacterized protein (TIGR00730 family)
VPPRVCVFLGSSRGAGDEYVRLAQQTARAIVRRGYGIVYGGGRIGLMGELADAALAAGGEVTGIIPRSLENPEIAHYGLTELHVVDTLHRRKELMAELSGAFLTLPGGIGTLDEFFDMLSWSQLGVHAKPNFLLNHRGFFDPSIAQLDHATREGFISPAHRALVTVVTKVEELAEQLTNQPEASSPSS